MVAIFRGGPFKRPVFVNVAKLTTVLYEPISASIWFVVYKKRSTSSLSPPTLEIQSLPSLLLSLSLSLSLSLC